MNKPPLIIICVLTFMNILDNPFLSPYSTPHDTHPFNEIKIYHYEPAFDKAIIEHRKYIDIIASNTEPATFSNTVEALEHSGDLISRVNNVFLNLLSAESGNEMMDISQRLSPKLSEHSSYIYLNEALFKRIKDVYDTRHISGLTSEQIRLTEKYLVDFERRGATLSPEYKKKYRQLSADLNKTTLEFGNNNLRETNAYEMLLTDNDDIAGLPESLLDTAASKACSKGKKGWMFDLSGPSYMAIWDL